MLDERKQNMINVIIIGLGNIGIEYDYMHSFINNKAYSSEKTLTHAMAVATHKDFNLVAGVDLQNERRSKFCVKYKCKTFDSIEVMPEELLNLRNLMVIVSTPTDTLLKVLHLVLERCKPIAMLIEKPCGRNYEEAIQIERLCNQREGMHVFVNYIRSYLPSVVYWKKRIKNNKLGKLVSGNIMYGKGIYTNGSHFINLVQEWVGELKIKSIIDMGESIFDFDHESTIALEAIDHPYALITVNSTGIGRLHTGIINLVFEYGQLIWPASGENIIFVPTNDESKDKHGYKSMNFEEQIYPTNIGHYQYEVLDGIANSIKSSTSQKENRSYSTIASGIQTMKTLSGLKFHV